MNAPLAEILAPEAIPSLLDEFRECCADYAWFYRSGWLEKADAVDCALGHAELWGAVDLYGQDAVQREMAQAFAAVDVMPDEAPPIAPAPAPERPREYRTPGATVNAFWHVASLDDPDHLARWLDQHPRDEKFLCKLWKAKNAAEA
jgi:hypothetical protein